MLYLLSSFLTMLTMLWESPPSPRSALAGYRTPDCTYQLCHELVQALAHAAELYYPLAVLVISPYLLLLLLLLPVMMPEAKRARCAPLHCLRRHLGFLLYALKLVCSATLGVSRVELYGNVSCILQFLELEPDEAVVDVLQVPEAGATQACATVVVVTAAGFMTHIPLKSLLQQTAATGFVRCVCLQVLLFDTVTSALT